MRESTHSYLFMEPGTDCLTRHSYWCLIVRHQAISTQLKIFVDRSRATSQNTFAQFLLSTTCAERVQTYTLTCLRKQSRNQNKPLGMVVVQKVVQPTGSRIGTWLAQTLLSNPKQNQFWRLSCWIDCKKLRLRETQFNSQRLVRTSRMANLNMQWGLFHSKSNG